MKSFKGMRIALSVTALVVGLVATISTAGATSKKTTVVKIGMVNSLSGPAGPYGIPYSQGAAFAVYQLNKTGFKVDGKKYKFSLISGNDNSDPATSVQVATGLISKHIPAMIGPLGPDSPGVVSLTNQAKVIIFDPSGAFTSGPPSAPLAFATNGSAADTGNYPINAIKTLDPSATSVAFLGTNEADNILSEARLLIAATNAGLTFFNLTYPDGTTNLSSVLTTLAADHPSVVLMYQNLSDETLQASQFAAAGIPKSTTMFLLASSISECQTLANPIGYPCIADPDTGVDFSSPDLTAFQKAWVTGFEAFTKTSSLPNYASSVAWSYDYVFLLAQAMTKAGTVTNTTKIAAALRNGHVVRNGLIGKVSFDANNVANISQAFSYVPVSGSVVTKSIAP